MYLFYGMFTDIFGACGIIIGLIVVIAIGLIAIVCLGLLVYAIPAIVIAFFRESYDWIIKKLKPNVINAGNETHPSTNVQ